MVKGMYWRPRIAATLKPNYSLVQRYLFICSCAFRKADRPVATDQPTKRKNVR
jgi:hypothetical protein